LSTVSGTGELNAMRSQATPLLGPHTATPSNDATTADTTPARSGAHRRWAA
jgi:hypothetical protein